MKGAGVIVVFVGDRHSPRMSPNAEPFVGARSEPRLKKWIEYVTGGTNNYILVNSYRAEDTKRIKEIAATANWTISRRIPGTAPIFIALGNTASKRLEKFKILHFKLPHPSGLNRQINNDNYIQGRLDACRDYIFRRM